MILSQYSLPYGTDRFPGRNRGKESMDYNNGLEDTARYAGLLLAPAEGFGRGYFCPSGKKRAYYAVLAHFWRFLVSSSNLGNF